MANILATPKHYSIASVHLFPNSEQSLPNLKLQEAQIQFYQKADQQFRPTAISSCIHFRVPIRGAL